MWCQYPNGDPTLTIPVQVSAVVQLETSEADPGQSDIRGSPYGSMIFSCGNSVG